MSKKTKYIISSRRLIVLDSNNEVLSFDIINRDGKTYLNPEGKNLDTGKETIVTVDMDKFLQLKEDKISNADFLLQTNKNTKGIKRART